MIIKDDLVPAELVRRGDILRSLKSFVTDVTTTADYRAGIQTAIWVASVIEGVDTLTPKKPTDCKTWKNDRQVVGRCPNCDEGVNSDMKFCDQCGQALDWGTE